METDDSLSEFEEDVKPVIKEEGIDEEIVDPLYSTADDVTYLSSMEFLDDDSTENLLVPIESKKDKSQTVASIAIEKPRNELPPPEMFTTSRSGRLVKRMFTLTPTVQSPKQKRKKTSVIKAPTPTSTPLPPGRRFCLVCYKKTDDSNSKFLASSIMERDFQVMFVLKKMLCVPRKNLADYIFRFGHPRKWVNFCDNCSPVVNKAIVVQEEISRLEETLRNYQREMQQKIKITRKTTKKTPARSCKDVIRITNETRDFVAAGKCCMFPNPANTSTVTMEQSKGKTPTKVEKPMRNKERCLQKQVTEMLENILARAARRKTVITDDHKKANLNLISVPPSHKSSTTDNAVDIQARKAPRKTVISNDKKKHKKQKKANLNVIPFSSPSFESFKTDNAVDILAQPAPLKTVITDDDLNKQKKKKRKKAKPVIIPFSPSFESSRKTYNADNAVDIAALNKICYLCEMCPHLKEMNSVLFSHHVLHHHKRPYRCNECGLFFSSTSELELEACPINQVRKEKGEKHICNSNTLEKVKFEPKNVWSCEYCSETFNFDFDRDSHEKICSLKSSSKIGVIALKNSCSICKNKYRNVAEWRIHMSLDHPDVASLTCQYCDSMFPVKTIEQKDLLDNEKMKTHLFKCHYSFKKFLKRITYCCDFCGEVFWNTTYLSQHVEAVHKINKMKTLTCGLCSYRHFRRCSIFKHLQNMHYFEKKINICEVCGFQTTCSLKLDNHKLILHKIQPKTRQTIKCLVQGCNFEAVGNRKLSIHSMKEHNAARKYFCDNCGKGFINKNHLRGHQQIHLNKTEKPFQCEVCGNSFAVKTYLYIHMRLSHQNRPFASTHKKKPTRKKKVSSTETIGSTDEHSHRDIGFGGMVN